MPLQGFVYNKKYYDIVRSLEHTKGAILGREGMTGARTRLLKGGFSSVVLLAEKGGNRLVIKIPVEERLAANEIYWYGMARRGGLSTPEMISHYGPSRAAPYSYLVLEYIDGMEPKSGKGLYAMGLFAGEQLRRLHRIRTAGFGGIGKGGGWSCRTWLDALKKERRPADERYALGMLSRAEIGRIHELTILNKELNISKPRLLHGDLYESNVIFAKNDGRYVIFDPGYTVSGDPMFDVAYATIRRSRGFDEGFADGYRVDTITAAERYRLERLRVFCLHKELYEYIKNKDSAANIKRIYESLEGAVLSFGAGMRR